MSGKDTQWIDAAYSVMSGANRPMHINEIEQEIVNRKLATNLPTLSLEVLLTKEAAMGRYFTKVDGEAGFFNLLPVAQVKQEDAPTSDTTPVAVPEEQPLTVNERYHIKYRALKKTCKEMIYLNAALYDEIARIEKKISTVTDERKILLSKLMCDQKIAEPKEAVKARVEAEKRKSESVEEGSKPKISKKKMSAMAEKRKEPDLSDDEESSTKRTPMLEVSEADPATTVKQKKLKKTICIPPIALDSNGRPVLPLELGSGLTLYSTGEICEKAGYCSPVSIFPVGFCCTRIFASLSNPKKSCLYTCNVSEGLTGPKFEISPDNEPGHLFSDETPEGCHNKLTEYFRSKIRGLDLPVTNHSDFFGLKHPVIKNLLQCSHGARKCPGYRWCKYEVTRTPGQVTAVPSDRDAATNFKSFVKLLNRTLNQEQMNTLN